MDKVTGWVNVIKIATDPDSPFQGMVELTDIFKESLAVQQQVFDALSEEEKQLLLIEMY